MSLRIYLNVFRIHMQLVSWCSNKQVANWRRSHGSFIASRSCIEQTLGNINTASQPGHLGVKPNGAYTLDVAPINMVKDQYRSRITNEHLHQCLRLAITPFVPKFKALAADQRCHLSHWTVADKLYYSSGLIWTLILGMVWFPFGGWVCEAVGGWVKWRYGYMEIDIVYTLIFLFCFSWTLINWPLTFWKKYFALTNLYGMLLLSMM